MTPEKRIPEPDVQASTLGNGLRVTTFPMPWLHETGATLFARAGSRFEAEEEAGIAHFLEHMLFRGTRRIPQPTHLHERLEALAADMNAATGQEGAAFWINLPPESLEEGFGLFCEMFTSPAFTAIDSERRVILAEMREDENDKGELINPYVIAGGYLWPGHSLGRPILGRRETIEGFTAAHLRDFLARHYHAGNLAVAFHGPLVHEESLKLCEKHLGRLPRGEAEAMLPPPAMARGPHFHAVEDQNAQLSLSLYFRVPGEKDPDCRYTFVARRLLDDGFSSRLPAILRESQGLVYDVGASATLHHDSGAFEVWASASPENLVRVYGHLLTEVGRLGREPPVAAEWQRLLVRYRAGLLSSLDHPDDLAERYSAAPLLGLYEPLSLSWERMTQIDPAQLPTHARTLFTPENLVVVLVGPRATQHLETLRAMGLGPLSER